MAESDKRLEVLEDELKLLKGEVKRTLVDLRALVMREDSPLQSDMDLVRYGKGPRDQSVEAVPVVAEREGVNGDKRKLAAMEEELKSLRDGQLEAARASASVPQPASPAALSYAQPASPAPVGYAQPASPAPVGYAQPASPGPLSYVPPVRPGPDHLISQGDQDGPGASPPSLQVQLPEQEAPSYQQDIDDRRTERDPEQPPPEAQPTGEHQPTGGGKESDSSASGRLGRRWPRLEPA